MKLPKPLLGDPDSFDPHGCAVSYAIESPLKVEILMCAYDGIIITFSRSMCAAVFQAGFPNSLIGVGKARTRRRFSLRPHASQCRATTT